MGLSRETDAWTVISIAEITYVGDWSAHMTMTEPVRCEARGQPGTFEGPAYEYENGAHYHDQCPDESGIPEGEIVTT